MKIGFRVGVTLFAAATFCLGDVSYQETVHYTGGTLLDMMKSMQTGIMGKMVGGRMGKALQDQTHKVYLKGNKMARIGTETSSIFDLDAGTMSTIDHERKTYSTVTFDEMNQRMEEMKSRMSKNSGQAPDIKFDVKVEETSNTRTIDGQSAKEYIMTLTASGQEGAGMKVRSEMWTVSSVSGEDELRAFQKKLAEKLANMSGFNPMMGAANTGLSQLAKEGMKLKGYPLEQNVAISGVQSPMNPMMAMRGGGNNSDPNAPFLVMTTTSGSFSGSVPDDTVFQIPAGYKEQKGRR
jgi:hypothetical protein